MTLIAEEVPAGFVAAELSRLTGVGVLLPADAGDVPISVDFRDVEGEAAVRHVAGLLGLGAVYGSGSVSLIPKNEVIDGFAIVQSGYVKAAEVQEALRALAGEGGKVAVIGQRVLAAGSAEYLAKVNQFAAHLDVGADGWHLDVRVIRVTDRLRRELGIDWDLHAGAEVSVDAAAGHLSGAAPIVGAKATALVSVLASAAESGSDAEVVYSAPLFVLEGEAGSLSQGERIPIPRRTVSDQGTVTTTGFDYVQTGFNLSAEAKRVHGGVRLRLEPSLSNVVAYVEGVPVVSRAAVESVAVMRSGDWLVLGGLEGTEVTESRSGLPGGRGSLLTSKRTREASGSTLLVLVRAVRVMASGGMDG